MKKVKDLVAAGLKKANLDRFSFAQMTSNSDGKTSGSGTSGVVIIAAGIIGFLVGVGAYFIDGKTDIVTESIILITIGAGLLGYRKSKDIPVTDAAVTPSEEVVSEDTPMDQPLNS